MEDQGNEEHQQLEGVELNNMEMEDVDVCENVHQHLNQPFGFGLKARKMKMVHRETRHSIQITRKKQDVFTDNHQDEEETPDTRGLITTSSGTLCSNLMFRMLFKFLVIL